MSSVQATCQAKREVLPVCKTWGKNPLAFEVRGNCCSQDKVRDNGDVTSYAYQDGLYHSVVCTHGLLVTDAHGILPTTCPVLFFAEWFPLDSLVADDDG